ncbi:hypothetical protein D3C71_581920 [compost metagenome]
MPAIANDTRPCFCELQSGGRGAQPIVVVLQLDEAGAERPGFPNRLATHERGRRAQEIAFQQQGTQQRLYRPFVEEHRKRLVGQGSAFGVDEERLREHDVVRRGVQEFQLGADAVLDAHIVAPQKRNERPIGRRKSLVDGRRGTAIPLLQQHDPVAELGGQQFGPAIGRTVIHDDHLKIPVGLPQGAVHRFNDELRLVEDGDDDSDQRRRHATRSVRRRTCGCVRPQHPPAPASFAAR